MISTVAAPALRVYLRWTRGLASGIRKAIVRLAYPGVTFERGVFLDEGVRVRVTDGGRLRVGANSRLGRQVTLIAKRGTIEIGRDGFVGDGATIVANQGVRIGRDCLIAEGVTIRGQNHGTELDGVPFRLPSSVAAPVEIGDSVWLAAKCTVLMGVRIGSDSVVGAHAVVPRAVPPSSVVVGIPARPSVPRLRSRASAPTGEE